MSTKPIPGHISVALAVVYVIAKIAELQLNEDNLKAIDANWKSYESKNSPHNDGIRLKHWATWSSENNNYGLHYDRKLAICSLAHISLSRETKDKTYSQAYRTDKVILNYYDESLIGKSDREKNSLGKYVALTPPYTKMINPVSGGLCGDGNSHNFIFPSRIGLAADFIIDRLKTGKLKSFLRTSDGRIINVPQEYWLTDQSEDVLEYDVHTLVRHSSGSDFGKISISLEDADEAAYQFDDGENMIDPARIFSFYPHHYSTGPNITPEPVAVLQNNRGGRPPVYDEIAFARVVLKILWKNGRPETKAELVKIASDQYEAEKLRGGRPSPEYARKKIAALWDDFDLGDEA